MSQTAKLDSSRQRRNQRPSSARQRILTTADRLFYNEGIHAVGIHRIVEESAVTRVTLYRHFPSKDELISAYLDGRAENDRDQIRGVLAAHPGDPRGALTELATVLTKDSFATMERGCPFINGAAEFTEPHPARVHAREHRAWVTSVVHDLLTALGHRSPVSTAQQLMMVRTGAVVSAALDENPNLNTDFVEGWEQLINRGLQDTKHSTEPNRDGSAT